MGSEAAEAEKIKANQAFKEKHYPLAVAGYSRAISLDPDNAIYYANRAAAHIRVENYGLALADASKSIELNPRYVKGYYRRADALYALGKVKQAYADFKRASKVVPNSSDLQQKLAECEKEVKRLRFEEALSTPAGKTLLGNPTLWRWFRPLVPFLCWLLACLRSFTLIRIPLGQDGEPKAPLSERLNLESMTVPDSYQGPRMEGSEKEGYRVSLQFVEDMMDTFKEQNRLHRRFAFQIIKDALLILKGLPTVVDIDVPTEEHVTVCGDVHGQYYDLLNIFKLNGMPSESNPYLFNGDFVDRGSFSVEVILTLFALKILYPKHLHLSRGNHESQGMNATFGFDGEVKAKHSALMIELFREAFCWLPLGHVLNGKVLVVHGGLFSKDSVSLEEIKAIDRNREPPDEGLMCELLWSDPQEEKGRAPSKRGVGVSFGPDITKNFLKANKLDLLVRSHEMKPDGYEIMHDGYCITVFSAPNYCDQMGNKGAFIRFDGSDMVPHFTTYEAVEHPDVKPMAYAPRQMNSIFGL